MNPQQKKPTFIKSVILSPDFTNKKERLRLDALCDLLQSCAGEHAQGLGVGKQLKEDKLVWVLSRIKVAITNMPRTGERIFIETWPKGVDKLFALRDFIIRNEKGEEMVKATTSWLLINLESKRPRRADMIVSRFENHLENALESRYESIAAPLKWSIQKPYKVISKDLDDNNHSNNVSYVRWFMDVLPKDLKAASITHMELHFVAETFLDDELVIKAYWNDLGDNEVLIEISRPKDQKAVAKAKLLLL